MIKLPDFSACVEIKYLFQKMGIEKIVELPEVKFVRERIEKRMVMVKNAQQLEFADKIKLESVRLDHEDFSVSDDQTLEVNGIKSSIYIMNQSQGYDFGNKTSTYKFHLCNCKTIQEMVQKGKKSRYVATSRDDGLFTVNPQGEFRESKPVPMHLELCDNCKRILQEQNIYFEPFTLKEFYKKYQVDIAKYFQREEQVIISEGYAPDHAEYARKYKEAVHYKCQLCGVDCSTLKSCLHMHHINGVRDDNKRSNIQILCILCHMEQFQHGHMKGNPKFKEAVQAVQHLRQEQGKYSIVHEQ